MVNVASLESMHFLSHESLTMSSYLSIHQRRRGGEFVLILLAREANENSEETTIGYKLASSCSKMLSAVTTMVLLALCAACF